MTGPNRCSAQVYTGMGNAHRCSRDGTVIRDCRSYCYQHDPVAVDRRRNDRVRKRVGRLQQATQASKLASRLAPYAERMHAVLQIASEALQDTSPAKQPVVELLNEIKAQAN